MSVALHDLKEGEIYSGYISEARYLIFEKRSEIKHEFFDRVVQARIGSDEQHEVVAGNLAFLLHDHLRGKRCRVFKSDMKLRVDSDDKILFYYPDIMVVCDKRDKNTIFKERPTLIIEVASKDWKRDYYEKLAAFLPIPSLKEYVVVWPDPKKPSVTIFRPDSGLKPAEVHKKGSFTLLSVGITIDVAEVYRE
jgi:Uma2 family endonuclease